ncbi:MAG: hypothetical protein ACR2P5_04205, partial [Gammaproteobacteria bacterium]
RRRIDYFCGINIAPQTQTAKKTRKINGAFSPRPPRFLMLGNIYNARKSGRVIIFRKNVLLRFHSGKTKIL